MNETPTPELVALLDAAAEVACSAYCDAAKLDGFDTPLDDSERGFHAKWMRIALEATRAATVPQGVSVPDGWVLVPREPTAHMVMAAHCAYFDENDASEVEFACMRLSVVAAIDAAMTPPPAELGKAHE